MNRILLLCVFSLLISACTGVSPKNSEVSEKEYSAITLDKTPKKWWQGEIFYEIWPRPFYDADGDGHGDFKGMTEKLDYLQDLGIQGVWLGPVFETPSYHGYDTEDFYAFAPEYGTMADFDEFLEAAHKRDIKVVLDLVLNHISTKHPWFIKSANRTPGFEDHFVWRKDRPQGWGRAWSSEPDPQAVWHWNETRGEFYYAAFGGGLPDINLTNPAVVQGLKDAATFWLNKGVDGFRLDAVRYAIEEGSYPLQADTKSTIDYWTDFAQHAKSVNPKVMLVGEAWVDLPIAARYGNSGKGLGSVFDFDFGYIVAEALNSDATRTADFGTASEGSKSTGREALWKNLIARDETASLPFYSPFLTNHDQHRIMHALKNNKAKAKIAASLLLTTPGTVYMYYGEEVGLSQNQFTDDQFRRAIMQWDESEYAGFNNTGALWLDDPKWFPWMNNHAPWWKTYWESLRGKGNSVSSQAQDESSLLNHYKRLIDVRKSSRVLRAPKEIRYYPVHNQNVWVVEYVSGRKSHWVVINLSDSMNEEFDLPKELSGKYKDLLTGEKLKLNDSLTLAPAQALILK